MIAVDAAGGELLGDGERVEHADSVPRAGLGAKQRAAWAYAGRLVQRVLRTEVQLVTTNTCGPTRAQVPSAARDSPSISSSPLSSQRAFKLSQRLRVRSRGAMNTSAPGVPSGSYFRYEAGCASCTSSQNVVSTETLCVP